VKRYSGHTTFLVFLLFPTALPFFPTSWRSIAKRRPTDKEHLERRTPRTNVDLVLSDVDTIFSARERDPAKRGKIVPLAQQLPLASRLAPLDRWSLLMPLESRFAVI
jgi:hypothetical protein